MRRVVATMGSVLAVLTAPAAAQTGPAFTVPPAELANALTCPQPLSGLSRVPVLLIPGTNTTPQEDFDWNYEPALSHAGIPWCTVTLPRYAMGDIQVSAEYVVAAIRTMHFASSRRVSIVGWSQGGMIGRWALKWWPDTRAMVEDLIGNAPSNHGTASARDVCASSCPPAYWQQRDDSKFTAALNAGQETFGGVDYTVNFTHGDEVVTPNADAKTGSSSLRTGVGHITNTAVQDICPNDGADHFMIGTYDPVAWALAYDALTHPGPADPARIDRGVCGQDYMPGVDRATFSANFARLLANVEQGFAASEYTSAEPPLACYVTSTCKASSVQGSATCPTRKLTVHLARGLRHVRVTLAGKRLHVHRSHGRATVRVTLTGARRVTLRIRATRKSGRAYRATRKLRACRATSG